VSANDWYDEAHGQDDDIEALVRSGVFEVCVNDSCGVANHWESMYECVACKGTLCRRCRVDSDLCHDCQRIDR